MYNATLSKLSGLIDDYWRDYVDHKPLRFVVKPSIPIIWFGNLAAYCSVPHQKRIVTVAINPSSHEFSKNGLPPYSIVQRFQNTRNLIDIMFLNEENKNILINAYNQYFTYNPYYTFFWAFEKTLQNLPNVASYYSKDDYDNIKEKPLLYKLYEYNCKKKKEPIMYRFHKPQCTAIHIDCRTALATTYLWTAGIKKFEGDEETYLAFEDAKAILSDNGKQLYEKLLEILDPSVVLISEASFKEKILDTEGSRLNDKNIATEKVSYELVSYKYNGRLWIYGRNQQSPFFLPTKKNKNAIQDEKEFFEEAFRIWKQSNSYN